MQVAEQAIEEQEAVEKYETGAAYRARGEAARNERLAKDCGSWVNMLGGVMGDDAPSADDMELPRDEEIPKLVSTAVSSLKRAQDGWSEARDRVYASYEEIRKFANSEGFRRIESEAEVAAHLHESDALVAAHNARKTAGLVEDRLKTIEHDLSRLDDDLEACVGELDRLLNTARSIMRRMIRDGRIPQDVPRFGGQPVFRMSADLSRVAATQRREILRSYVSDLAEADRVPQTGQDVAAELVDRMTMALGRSTLGIRLLKPKGEGDTEHMPIDQVTVSGGELLTAAMMIYLVLARLRAESMHGGPGESGVLIMDNPLGKANKALLLKTQIGLADAMGIQLFYTTGVQGTSALAEFENILVLENYHSFDSFRRWNRKTALYAAVAYGSGNAFRQGADNLDDVMERIDADGAVYVADLDPAGVRILIGVNTRRQEEGRAALRPHRGLYRWLLAHGCRRPLDAAPRAELVQRLGETFPPDVVSALVELWSGRERVPQESFGLQQLGGRDVEVASPGGA